MLKKYLKYQPPRQQETETLKSRVFPLKVKNFCPKLGKPKKLLYVSHRKRHPLTGEEHKPWYLWLDGRMDGHMTTCTQRATSHKCSILFSNNTLRPVKSYLGLLCSGLQPTLAFRVCFRATLEHVEDTRLRSIHFTLGLLLTRVQTHRIIMAWGDIRTLSITLTGLKYKFKDTWGLC